VEAGFGSGDGGVIGVGGFEVAAGPGGAVVAGPVVPWSRLGPGRERDGGLAWSGDLDAVLVERREQALANSPGAAQRSSAWTAPMTLRVTP